MMKQRALTYILLVGALFGSAACSELAGSGELVDIPPVTFECSNATASNCGGAGSLNFFRVVYSTFGCANGGDQIFNASRTQTGYMSCTATKCTGTASGAWLDRNATTTKMPADSYTLCIVVFRNTGPADGDTTADAYAEENVVVNSSSPTFNILNFVNGTP